MHTIVVVTEIAAPPERCFLLSLSIDLHTESTERIGEKAIAGVTRGLIGPGQSVTWQGRHFGLLLTHASRITQYERPRYFQDSMIQGVFRTFVHDHHFEAVGNGTRMRDELRFSAPLGPLGWLAEVLVLRRHMRRFLIERNQALRKAAESEQWRIYLDGLSR